MTREETLEAFVCCAQARTVCKNCPLKGPIGEQGRECKSELITSVCHWLVVQEHEPRIMTLEELRQAKDVWVWMERRFDSFKGRPYNIEAEFHTSVDKDGNHFFVDRASRPEECYEKMWRCWNNIPTDEQRKNMPWKE